MTVQAARPTAPGRPPTKPRPVAQSSGAATSLALVGAVVTTIANFGIAIMVTRAGAAFAGLFFAATAVVTILGNSSALGTMTGLVYFMPAALAIPNPELDPNPRALLQVALRPVVGAGLGVAAALLIVADPLASLIADNGADQVTAMLRVLAVAVPCWGVTVSLLGATRGLGSMTPTVVVNQILRPLGQLGLVAAVVATQAVPSGQAIAVAWGLPVVAGVGASVFSVWRLGGFVGGGTSPVSSAEFWHYARPRAASTTFQIALERIDVIIVSALAGEAAAGVYGALSRFITAGNFLIFAIGQATSSQLRRALAADRRAEAQALLAKTTSWMVLLAWPYFLVIAIKAGVLASLLSPEFDVGASALTILAIAMLASAFAGPVDLTLLMLGRTKESLAITVVALIIDLAIAAYAIPRFGLVGAALAWGAAVIVQNGLAALRIHRLGQLRAGGRPAVIAGLGALVAVVPIGLITPDHLGGTLATVILGGTIWLMVAASFRRQLGLVRHS
ncbi:MAG: hypothetical protein GY773_05085 [Actinomycetia bacterium]|nr:hypothetical protein [Actinomycetes bacterium]